jgi:hypothetical protein
MNEKNQPYKNSILRFPRVEEGRAQIWDSRAFLKATFPPREPLVVIDGKDTPVFTKHSINQIFATRGTGKSMLMMALAGMQSTGGNFLNWRITRPASVLYVDGELPNPQIQERMAQLHSSDARIHLITLDDHPNGIPTLDTAPGQEWLEKELGGVEVLVLDSVASLARFPRMMSKSGYLLSCGCNDYVRADFASIFCIRLERGDYNGDIAAVMTRLMCR